MEALLSQMSLQIIAENSPHRALTFCNTRIHTRERDTKLPQLISWSLHLSSYPGGEPHWIHS